MHACIDSVAADARWLRYIARHGGAHSRWAVALMVLQAVMAAAVPWVLGRLAGELTAGDMDAVTLPLCALVVLLMGGGVLDVVSERAIALGSSSVLTSLFGDLARLAALDTPRDGMERRDALKAIEQDLASWPVMDGLNAQMTVVYMRCLGIGSAVLVALWNPLATVLLVMAYLAISQLGTMWLSAVGSAEPTIEQQHADYWRETLLGSAARRELRIFGLAKEFSRRFEESWQAFHRSTSKGFMRQAKALYAADLVLVALYLGAFAWLARDVSAGTVGVAVMITIVGALINLSGFGMVGDAAFSASACMRVVSRIHDFANETAGDSSDDDADDGTGGGAVPELKGEGASHQICDAEPAAARVLVHDASYRYPGSDRPAVDGVTLDLAPGSVTALVGVNGSGKSTLARLLTGLMQPDEGTILIDGEADRLGRVSAVFQDPTHFPLDVTDNIALGLDSEQNSGGCNGAGDDIRRISRSVGVDDSVLERETAVGEYPGLSGGQWSRVALARCLAHAYRRGGLVILDEPTAAMDPIAEQRLFHDFRSLTRGLTCLLVTHRLGSIVDADRIIVMDDGHIAQSGTHSELMGQSGIYADLFDTQRRALLGSDSESAGGSGLGTDGDVDGAAEGNTGGSTDE